MSFVSVSCGMKMKNIRVSVGGTEVLDNEARPWGGFSYLWQSPAAPVNSMGMGRVKALLELNKMIATEYQHLGIQGTGCQGLMCLTSSQMTSIA